MKKNILIVFLLFFGFILKSQNVTETYNNIANICGKDIANKIQLKEEIIQQNLGNKHDLNIGILPLKNDKNEFTKITNDLSPLLANVIQQNIKSTYSHFNSISVKFIIDNSDLTIFDYILKANYFLDNEVFTINNISLIKPDNSGQLALESSKMTINTSQLKLIDFALVSDNIEQLSRAICMQFSNIEGLRNVKLNNFVNMDNNLPSQFSEYLASQLESDLVSMVDFSVERNISRGLDANVQYLVTGNYVLDGDNLKVISFVKDPTGNITKGSATAFLKLDYLKKNNISFIPQNEQLFEQRQDVLDNANTSSELLVDVWTNKGNNNPIFKEGELLQFKLEVNKPCYIRLIDVFADGTQILLLDNFQLTEEMTGKPFIMPNTFECAGPDFGAETIILVAQTDKPFNQLNTVNFFGYKKITDQLNTIIKSFMPVTVKYLNVVTVPK